jgi:hypothetical protein
MLACLALGNALPRREIRQEKLTKSAPSGVATAFLAAGRQNKGQKNIAKPLQTIAGS